MFYPQTPFFDSGTISGIALKGELGFLCDVTARNEFLLVDVGEFKTFKPINNQTYDDLALAVIRSATEKAEAYIQDFLLTTSVVLYWDSTNYDVKVPYANLAISAISSIDYEGIETALVVNTDYILTGYKYKKIRLLNYVCDSLKVTGTVGRYTLPSQVPQSIKDAIKHIAKYLFSNASGIALDIQLSASSGLPLQAELLLNDFINYRQ